MNILTFISNITKTCTKISQTLKLLYFYFIFKFMYVFLTATSMFCFNSVKLEYNLT